MADIIVDSLQIKIEKAKRGLPAETLNAIAAVDWRAAILAMRTKKGYTFEQLGDLELETELLLCGLLSPKDYPRELEKRMGISRSAADELVNEMNNQIFKKIREELVKNIERKKMFARNMTSPIEPAPSSFDYSPVIKKEPEKIRTGEQILESAGIEVVEQPIELGVGQNPGSREEILKKLENPEKVHPIISQKLSQSFQVPTVKTEHTLENITKTNTPSAAAKPKVPYADPYREIPE